MLFQTASHDLIFPPWLETFAVTTPGDIEEELKLLSPSSHSSILRWEGNLLLKWYSVELGS